MEELGGPPDPDLVRRALGAATPGERKAAFEAIADKHHLTVFRWCAYRFPHPEEAQDVCQAAFEAAFTLLTAGTGPERPGKLAGWLIEIARRRGLEYQRKARPAGVKWAILPEGQSLDEIEDDEEPRSGSATRRAHATRLVEAVVATLTARQQQVYQLRIMEELTGKQVAERLSISGKAASNEITHVQGLIANGFGALILFQEGRRYCPNLARIIESAPAAAGTPAFTTMLREQIVRHFDNCNICDDCRTCNAKRRELVGPYVPVLIPILFAADLRDRIYEFIRQTCTPPGDQAPGQQEPGDPQALATSGSSGTEATLDASVSGMSAEPAQATGQATGHRVRSLSGKAWRGRGGAILAVSAVILVLIAAAAVALPRILQHRPPPPPSAAPPGSSPGGGGDSGGGGTPPAIVYTTTTAVLLRDGAGPPRVLGTLPKADPSPALAWSADGKKVAWLGGGTLHLASASGGPSQHWPCPACSGIAFRGSQVVTVPASAAGGQFTAAVPELLSFSPGSPSPAVEPVSGIATSKILAGIDTDFLIVGTLPGNTLVVAYGSAGGSDLGGPQQLYRVDQAGHATPYGKQSNLSGSLGGFTASQSGSQSVLVAYTRGGACGGGETTYVVDSHTGAVTVPAIPSGGGPDGFWTDGLWYDSTGTAYASFVPNLDDCATTGAPATIDQPANATPIVCKLEGNAWVKTGTGTLQARYTTGGWLARRTGTTSTPGAAGTGTLVLSHGTTTITIPGVSAFAWAP